jgi:hypothetical protein
VWAEGQYGRGNPLGVLASHSLGSVCHRVTDDWGAGQWTGWLCRETIHLVSEERPAGGADSIAIRTELPAGIARRRGKYEAAGERAGELPRLPPDTVATPRSPGERIRAWRDRHRS